MCISNVAVADISMRFSLLFMVCSDVFSLAMVVPISLCMAWATVKIQSNPLLAASGCHRGKLHRLYINQIAQPATGTDQLTARFRM